MRRFIFGNVIDIVHGLKDNILIIFQWVSGNETYGSKLVLFLLAKRKGRNKMKLVKKRLLCLILSILALLNALPLTALADTAVPIEEGVICSDMLENVEGLNEDNLLENVSPGLSVPSANYAGGDMYSQLTQRQKACYTAIEKVTMANLMGSQIIQANGYAYRRVMFQINGISGTRVSGVLNNGSFSPSTAGRAVTKGVYTDICAAIVALRYDRPDILWLSRVLYGYRVTQTTSTSAVITHVIVDFHLPYEGREKTMQEACASRAKAIAAQASGEPDTYSKLKRVYSLLAAGNRYGNVDDPMAHTAYSALFTGDEYDPVCEGYAKAIKLVCDYLDIPCVLASSTTHMWNNVRMDDGYWYILDLTWDNSSASGEVRSNYFLIGSESQINGEVFSKQKDHIEENPYVSYYNQAKNNLNMLTLRFPKKNTEAYEYIGADRKPGYFPDVQRGVWYFDPIQSAYEMGLFEGDDKGNFNPNNRITRAQFVKVMAAALDVDLTGYTASSFKDVPAGRWFTPAVAWAKESGVVGGYEDGTFRPNANISRQEMCVIISRTLKSQPDKQAFAFPDDRKISGWAKDGVYTCYALGLVQGDDKGNFSPGNSTLRSQAAVVFTRYAALGEEYLPAA